MITPSKFDDFNAWDLKESQCVTRSPETVLEWCVIVNIQYNSLLAFYSLQEELFIFPFHTYSSQWQTFYFNFCLLYLWHTRNLFEHSASFYIHLKNLMLHQLQKIVKFGMNFHTIGRILARPKNRMDWRCSDFYCCIFSVEY